MSGGLATYTGKTARALVKFCFTTDDELDDLRRTDQKPHEVLVPAGTKAGDVTRAVYPKGHQWFEVCAGPTCKVIRLIDEVETEMEARVAGDLLEAPAKLNGYPVIRWYEARTAKGQIGVAMVRRPDSVFGCDRAWAIWVCYPISRTPVTWSSIMAPMDEVDADQYNEWGLDSGHYDLTIDEAEDDFFERCRRIGR